MEKPRAKIDSGSTEPLVLLPNFNYFITKFSPCQQTRWTFLFRLLLRSFLWSITTFLPSLIRETLHSVQVNIYIYLNFGETCEDMIDHRCYTHILSGCEIEACKKFRPERDSEVF